MNELQMYKETIDKPLSPFSSIMYCSLSVIMSSSTPLMKIKRKVNKVMSHFQAVLTRIFQEKIHPHC